MSKEPNQKRRIFFYSILILLVSYFTYFRNYWYPPNLFWDENYHIASAQKYLNKVFFMEHHPPLGKMFVALGEYIFQPNKNLDTRYFLTTDYIKDIPKGYSFVGVRFFPTFFATISAPLFFLILFVISKNPHLSLLFSSLYLFENALIVHNRGAMLEGIQIFFVLLTIFYWLLLMEKKAITKKEYGVLGLLVGLALATKLNSVFLILLFPILFFGNFMSLRGPRFSRGLKKTSFWGAERLQNRADSGQARMTLVRSRNEFGMTTESLAITRGLLRDFIVKGLAFGWGIFIIFAATYYLHIALGQKVVDGRYYQASEKYKTIIKDKKAGNLTNFALLFQEHLAFIPHYERGVPKYDVCKADENGSLPWTWPVGNKTINYRWEKDGGVTRYLYLQGNPVIWFFGLVAIILGISQVLAKIFFQLKIENKRLFFYLSSFVLMYIMYMAMTIKVTRVLYLYHYFIPLLVSLIVGFILFNYLFEKAIRRKEAFLYFEVVLIIVMVVLTYYFFSPLTYYQPLTYQQFQLRNWFPFWKIKAIL